MKGKLYLVSTPIGNYDDITIRALDVLRNCDFIICEELKEAGRLLSHFKIKKEFFALNEHNEEEEAPVFCYKIKEGKIAALISDGGTPLFSDPGHLLVKLCLAAKIDVIPVPGANSLIPALTGSGLEIEKFYYYGWLSPKKEIRRNELNRLKKTRELIVFLETPYRLQKILADIVNFISPSVFVVLAYRLTQKDEKFFRGKASEILALAEKLSLKGEFVLLVDNR